jgi:hypothetical protein
MESDYDWRRAVVCPVESPPTYRLNGICAKNVCRSGSKQLDEPVWIEGQLDPVTVTGVPVDGDARSAAHMPSLSTDSRTEKRLDGTTGASATAGDMNSRCAPPERGRQTRAFLRSPLF